MYMQTHPPPWYKGGGGVTLRYFEKLLPLIDSVLCRLQDDVNIMGNINIVSFDKAMYQDALYAVTADRLAQLVEYRTTVWEVVGSNPGRTNT